MAAAPPWQEIAVPDDAVAVTPAKKARKARKEPGAKAAKTARQAAIPVRFVTASSLFDGHDASINVMRRILQAAGAEVIHLGHNRSVDDVVTAAVQEDAHAVAVSSYQGGHMEYFRYMIDLLAERGRADVKVFAGGGGVIVADEASALEAYGVSHVYTPRATTGPWPASSRPWRTGRWMRSAWARSAPLPRGARAFPCSASPGPAVPASRPSSTN